MRGPGGPEPGFGRGVDVLGVEPLEFSEPVTGAPYSADTGTEVVQQLADGNRIVQRATGSVARDAQGRIRREQTLTGFGPVQSGSAVRIVTISNPAERRQFRLDEMRKTAWVLRLPPPRPMREPPAGGPPAGAPPAPPSQPLRTEQLAPMQIEGVRAEGTRTVLVLPAGTLGNERPIEIVNERWYSPELQTVVLTRRLDPRYGEVTFRLLNIVRAEPAAELFSVPADFTVRDEPRPPMPRPR
jgi:hypothetical protein